MAGVNVRAASVVVSLLLLLGAGSAHAFNPQPDPPGFGMFGITEVQRAHLHVALPAVQRTRGGLPPGPCRVEMSFVNEAGAVVWIETHSIMPGQTANMIFTPTREVPAPTGETTAALLPAVRHQLRAIVNPLDSTLPPGPCKGLVATVQVDNQAGGAPTLTLSPRDPQAGPNGNVSVTHLFGPLAIGFGHTARLNAVNTGMGVCNVSWVFVDEAGARTGGVVMVRGGTAVHADFAHTDETRGVARIRAEVTTSGKACAADATIGTLEGFDSALGHSHSIVPAQLILPAVQ
jgi:hypothetical protein